MGPIDEAAVAAAWDRNADLWIAQVRAGRDAFREIVNNPLFLDGFLPDLSGRTMLDLGCGEGRNTRLLARRGARMTGIDLSSRMIAAARDAEMAEPLGITYREGSFTRLEGIGDASFDAAISTMALMDGPDLEGAARAVHRVLRADGTFHFSVIHPCFWTRSSRWIKSEAGEIEGMLVGEYWQDAPHVERWRFSLVPADEAPPFDVPRFPYRLENYVNALIAAGFRITALAEPRPTEAMAAAFPDWLGRLRRHVPILLYLAAAKD
jgi:SAM-dependent methyltransferase